ncbi:hypothetical protein DL764_006287 [Monosporascus ibericus]|uniref:Uncharacterized protein n=1 Tax=Monosporascus ibericus TaxID=155417 RepID=A0A4Q4T581_9PEZI|nr:hypothetical protein DL764_006287 [Monosporascus ibericus]
MPRRRMRETSFLDTLFFGTSSFSRTARRERYIVPVYYPGNPGRLESVTPGDEQPQKPKKVHFASPEPGDSDDTAEDSFTPADDSTGSDTTSGSEDAAELGSATPPPTDKKATAGNSAEAKMKKDKSGSKAKSKDKAQGKAKDQDRAKGKQQQQQEKEKDESKRKGDEGKKNKKKRKRKGRKVVLYIPDSDSSESSEENEESASSSGSDVQDEKPGDAAKEDDYSSSPFDFPEEHARSKEYFYRHVLRGMYPVQLRIEPDGEFWSADDCRVLATLEARQRALRWEHLQSEFHNATGRMVPLDLLKAKVESAEEL